MAKEQRRIEKAAAQHAAQAFIAHRQRQFMTMGLFLDGEAESPGE